MSGELSIKQISNDPNQKDDVKEYGNDEKAVLNYLESASKVEVNYQSHVYRGDENIGDVGTYQRVRASAAETNLDNMRRENLKNRSLEEENDRYSQQTDDGINYDEYSDYLKNRQQSQASNANIQKNIEEQAPVSNSVPEEKNSAAGTNFDASKATVSLSDVSTYDENRERFEKQNANNKIQEVNLPTNLSNIDSELELNGTLVPEKINEVEDFVTSKFDENKNGQWKWKENKDVIAFREKTEKMTTKSKSPLVASSMIAVADARGWSELKVKGSDKFKREAWLEGELRGIKVSGYVPSAKDKEELNNSLGSIERIGKPNEVKRDIELTPKQLKYKNQLSDAYENLDPKTAQREHPELKNIYQITASASKFADSTNMPDSQKNKFVSSVNNKAITSVAQGNVNNPTKINYNKINVSHEQKLDYAK